MCSKYFDIIELSKFKLLFLFLLIGFNLNADESYFLDFKQKGQLIGKGRVQDKNGIWYDVWITPGYIYPVQKGKKNIKQSGENMAEYFSKKKYKDLVKTSKDCYEWSYKKSLRDFTFKGARKSWKKNLSDAKGRVDKRVFAWQLAYPWAVLKSSVDNIIRIPVGVAGSTVGVSVGTVGVPAYYLTNSSAKASWNFAVEGLALPAASMTWNTVASPPLAMVGQKPSPQRVDNFWVVMIDEDKERFAEKMSVLAIELKRVSKTEDSEIQEIKEKYNREKEKLYERLKQLEEEKKDAIKKLNKVKINEAMRKNTISLEIPEATESLLGYNENIIREKLKKKGYKNQEIQRMLEQVREYLKHTRHESLDQTQPPKTDPLKESIEVIKEIK